MAHGVRLIFLLAGAVGLVPVITGKECKDSLVCDASCMAVERAIHRLGTTASASFLTAIPSYTNNYVLCYAKLLSGGQKSQLLCLHGSMDELATAEPQFITLLEGSVTRFKTFRLHAENYLLVHRIERSPEVFKLSLTENGQVNLTSIITIPAKGNSETSIIRQDQENKLYIVLGSGRNCRDGDARCLSPSISIVQDKSDVVKQCAVHPVTFADAVAGWSYGKDVFVVFATPLSNTRGFYRIDLFKLNIHENGQCGLDYVQEILRGRPVCGLLSMEMIRSSDGQYNLLIASRPCPGWSDVKVLHYRWDPLSGLFENRDEIPNTSKVLRVWALSDKYLLLQRDSQPSTIHVPTLNQGNSLRGTVRINNEAFLSSVEAANGDVYVSHVSSTGSVIVDWISCAGQHSRLSNYTLTSYSAGNTIAGEGENETNYITTGDTNKPHWQTALQRDDRHLAHFWRLQQQKSHAVQDLNTTAPSNLSENSTSSAGSADQSLRYEETLVDPVLETAAVEPTPTPRNPQYMPHFRTDNLNGRMPAPFEEHLQPYPAQQHVFPMGHNGKSQPEHMQASNRPADYAMGANHLMFSTFPQRHSQNTDGFTFMGQPSFVSSHYMPTFGVPQQVPPGSMLTGYFTFPPVAIFTPITPNHHVLESQKPRQPENARQSHQMQEVRPTFPQVPLSPVLMQPEVPNSNQGMPSPPQWFPPSAPVQPYQPENTQTAFVPPVYDSRQQTPQWSSLPQQPIDILPVPANFFNSTDLPNTTFQGLLVTEPYTLVTITENHDLPITEMVPTTDLTTLGTAEPLTEGSTQSFIPSLPAEASVETTLAAENSQAQLATTMSILDELATSAAPESV